MEDKNNCSKSILKCKNCDCYDSKNQFCSAFGIDSYSECFACYLYQSQTTIKL